MAEALEERATQEVVDRDIAIEALKKEVEMVEVEKARLVNEVAGLHAAQSDIEDLREKVEFLSKALEGKGC